MSKPLFSIIIPAYNTVQYLRPCMDSLFAQSCNNFEVLLMDDGSSDGTAQLADDFAASDARIRSFHLPHAGASSARNAGLQEATGEYALFLDSDDMLVPDTLERMANQLHDHPDMVWFGFLYAMPDDSIRTGQKLHDRHYASASEAVLDWIHTNIMPISAANKIFRLSVIREFGIRFREHVRFGEDRLFNLDFLRHCGSVATSSNNLYVYTTRNNSASHRFVPGLLSTLLMIHHERLSTIAALCKSQMTEEEWRSFACTDYVDTVTSAWSHVSEYYSTLTREQREHELRPFLGIRFPNHTGKGRTLWRRAWISLLETAHKFRSLHLLRLMMFITCLRHRNPAS